MEYYIVFIIVKRMEISGRFKFGKNILRKLDYYMIEFIKY